MSRSLLLAVTMVLLSLSSVPAMALFRCDGRQVIGFSKFDLLSTCGEPVYKDSYTDSDGNDAGAQSAGVSCKTIDQWYYIDPETHYNYQIDIERGYVTRVIRGQLNNEAN